MFHFSQRYVGNLHRLVYFLFWLHIKEQLSSILLRTLQEKTEQNGPYKAELQAVCSSPEPRQTYAVLCYWILLAFVWVFSPKISQDIKMFEDQDFSWNSEDICITWHECQIVSPSISVNLGKEQNRQNLLNTGVPSIHLGALTEIHLSKTHLSK